MSRMGTAATDFVGRDADLSDLLHAAERARGGRGSLVLVSGEAGIGKTRLLEELGERAAARGDAVLWAACWEGDGAPAYWPWTQVLRSCLELPGAADVVDSLAHRRDELARIVPELGGAALPAAELDADAARFPLFDAVATILGRVGTTHPLVVALDDLHWADLPSLRLLAFLSTELRSCPVLVVGTYRDVESEPGTPMGDALNVLIRGAEHIPLAGLGEADLATFIAAAGGEGADAGLVAAVHRRTGGNPFFTRELVRLLRSRGSLEKATLATGGLPPTVRAVLERRLARLSQPCQDVLTFAAVVGSEFDLDVVAAAAGGDREEIARLLGEAIDGRLVVEAPRTLLTYHFVHALIRETLYEGLGAARRAELHRRVALAVESVAADRPDAPVTELARHFVAAASLGERDKAVRYSTAAGDAAFAALAYEEAVEHYRRAIGLLDAADDARRADLLVALGEASLRSGDMTDADSAFRAAAELARSAGDPERLARVALAFGAGLGGFEVTLFHTTQIALLEEANAALGSADSAMKARTLGRLSVALSITESEDRRLGLAEDAVAMARRVGDPGVLAAALASHCDAIAGPDHRSTREFEAGEIVRLAEGLGDVGMQLLGRRLRVLAFMEAGDFTAVDDEIEAYRRAAAALGQPLYAWYVPLWHGMRALMRGELDEATRLCAEARATGARANSTNAFVLSAVQRSIILGEEGRLEEAAAEMLSIGDGYLSSIPSSHPSLTLALLLTGREAEAHRGLDRIVDERMNSLPHDAEWLPCVTVLADLAVDLAHHEAAELAYDLLLPYADRFSVEGIGAATYGSCERHLGRLAAALGRTDDAAAHFDRALAANRAAGASLLVGLTQVQRAEALGERERPVDATENAFRRDGDVWTLTFAGRTAMVRDAKGLRDIAALLAAPGRDIHVTELAGGEVGGAAHEPKLDRRAVESYRRRLADIDEELAAAEADNDAGRAERVRAEREFLLDELRTATGLGGRSRTLDAGAERVRKAVGARIKLSLDKLGDAHPELARHLRNSVRTGVFCSYQPERPIDWRL